LTPTYVWKPDQGQQPIGSTAWEDNAFVLLKTVDGKVGSLHASCTQWKNLFSFEIFGREGYLLIEGLGGSYGVETLKIGKRKKEGGPPNEEIIEFPGSDLSWKEEWREFVSAINGNRNPLGDVHDGLKAMELVDAIYRSAKEGRVVNLL
jgi:predicted dehydrogenase